MSSLNWAHDTQVASNGADAWRMYEEWYPDLVVLDVGMPGVDGLEVCRRIRELDDKREVFVLFLTGRDHPETLEMVLDAGGDEFIAKPTTPEDLRARLIVARRRIAQDAARRTAEDQLSKARWLSGIGEATLALQHEINNPLSALLGNAELMIMELEEEESAMSCWTSFTSRRCELPMWFGACDASRIPKVLITLGARV